MNEPRPRLALWLKWHYRVLRWLPWLGGLVWGWADAWVDRWHAANGRPNT